MEILIGVGLALKASAVAIGAKSAIIGTKLGLLGAKATAGALAAKSSAAVAAGAAASSSAALSGASIAGAAAVGGAGGIKTALSALALMGGVVQGVGSYVQSQARANYENAQAQVQASQAQYSAAAIYAGANREVTESKRNLLRAMGGTQAQAARNGLVLGGSSTDVLFDMEAEAEREQEDILANADRQSYRFRSQSQLSGSANYGAGLLSSVLAGAAKVSPAVLGVRNALTPQGGTP